MKKPFKLIYIAFLSLVSAGVICGPSIFSFEQLEPKPDSTIVIVIGTIHGNHESNKNFSYQDLLNVLATFHPDAICVEIPPNYFRKESYLKEMMLASMYGIEHSLKVYPIDWWPSGDDRIKREEYMKTEEYKLKEKHYYELEKSNKIMQNFYKKYGSLDSLWGENKQSCQFFNGDEYNDYIREMYAINMAVFGDGPMNLSYQTRNSKMLELIINAVSENKNKRIAVLTGAEHKHFFDIELTKRNDIKLVKLKDILPIREEKPSKYISDFIEKNLARNYYDVTDPEKTIDMMYQGALISLIHGPGMDHNPSIIPDTNVEQAKVIIEDWKSEYPNSAYLQFELAWVEFLYGNYKQSIAILESIVSRLEEIPESTQWFIKTFYYRNLGFCYDLLGERDKAINCYNDGIAVCKILGINESYVKMTYGKYLEEPYKWKEQ